MVFVKLQLDVVVTRRVAASNTQVPVQVNSVTPTRLVVVLRICVEVVVEVRVPSVLKTTVPEFDHSVWRTKWVPGGLPAGRGFG